MIFILYFLISGLVCYYSAIQLERDDLPEKEQEKIDDMRKEIFYHFGTLNIYPLLYIMCLIFGWILLPIAFVFDIIEKFKKEE